MYKASLDLEVKTRAEVEEFLRLALKKLWVMYMAFTVVLCVLLLFGESWRR